MTERLNEWLSRRAEVAGVLACGLAHPDLSTYTRIGRSDFSRESLENAWRCIADTFRVLRHHHAAGLHLRWVFEQSLLYCLTRADGTCLMVFITSKTQELDASGLQAMFEEFHSFPG